MFEHKCKRCLGIWETVLENPKRCGVCGTPLWDRTPERAAGAGRPKGGIKRILSGAQQVNAGGTGVAEPRTRASESDRAATNSGPGSPQPAAKVGELTIEAEIEARFRQAEAENPEADRGVLRRSVTEAVKKIRREREQAQMVEELRGKFGGMVKAGKEVFGR